MELLKKIAIQIHKYTGILMSVLFLTWCLTGFVLLFVGFPHASRQERFEQLETLSKADTTRVRALSNKYSKSYRLEKYGDYAVYRIKKGKKKQLIIHAKTLEPIKQFSYGECKQIAKSFANAEIIKVDSLSTLDSWIPWSYYKPLLPFYKFYFNDPQHSVLYASVKTGEIIQKTDRKTRWFARLGAIPHWVYFKRIKSNPKLWENIIVILGIIGLLVCFSGIILGFIRIKRNKKGKVISISVFKNFLFKYHHVFGLFVGLILFTYLLSGMFYATGVPSWVSKKEQGSHAQRKWNKEQNIAHISPHSVLCQLSENDSIRAIEWGESMQTPVVRVYTNEYKQAQVFQVSAGQKLVPFRVSKSLIERRANELFPDLEIEVDLQSEYDFYYEINGMHYHPAPVFRLTINNEFNDVLYIDPLTGKSVEYFNNNKRSRRILTKTLHKFEFPFLHKHNLLRIIVSILVLIACTVVSLTALVLSYKYLSRKIFKTNKPNYEEYE